MTIATQPRLQRKRRDVDSPEQAPGFVTCLGCSGWPIVHRMRGSGIWMAWCRRCLGHVSTASSKELLRVEWNERNWRVG